MLTGFTKRQFLAYYQMLMGGTVCTLLSGLISMLTAGTLWMLFSTYTKDRYDHKANLLFDYALRPLMMAIQLANDLVVYTFRK
jgi:hypothetical protein